MRYRIRIHQEIEKKGVAPKGFKPITEEEFAKSEFFQYIPNYLEYRKITELHSGKVLKRSIEVVLYYFADDSGYGLEAYKSKVRYYKWGCVHKFEPITLDSDTSIPEGKQVAQCVKCKKIKTF